MKDARSFILFFKLAFGQPPRHLHTNTQHGFCHFNMLPLKKGLGVFSVTKDPSSSARRNSIRPSGNSTISRKDVGIKVGSPRKRGIISVIPQEFATFYGALMTS